MEEVFLDIARDRRGGDQAQRPVAAVPDV
jgi:hypothetical protein